MPKDETGVPVQQTTLRIEFKSNTEHLSERDQKIIGQLVRDTDKVRAAKKPITLIKIYATNPERAAHLPEHQFTAECGQKVTGRMVPEIIWLVCYNKHTGWYLAPPHKATLQKPA